MQNAFSQLHGTAHITGLLLVDLEHEPIGRHCYESRTVINRAVLQ